MRAGVERTGRTEVESALLARGALVMTLRIIMMVEVCVWVRARCGSCWRDRLD